MKNENENKMDFSIILFLCNWGPHTAFQTLQNGAAQIPSEIMMVRIPCSGRINKTLLFKPFEMGADGVVLAGCETGVCRYGAGTSTAKKNVEHARAILHMLGLGVDRLRLKTFMPEEAEGLLQFLKDFCNEIKAFGKSPVVPSKAVRPMLAEPELIKEALKAHDIYACQDCGKCSSACPLTLAGKPFSPRAIASNLISDDTDSAGIEKDVWSCLSCGLCYDRCPSAVNFPEFIKDMRHIFKKEGARGYLAHGGFFQSLMRTMTTRNLKVNHWHWLPDNIQIDPKSKTLFFGGCAPYFDIFFDGFLGIRTRDILKDSLRLLNFFDIYPALLEDERCCGHDLLWSGDKENFLKLARWNLHAIHDAGIEEIITTCPECYRAYTHDYPGQGVGVDFKVTHLFDLLEEQIGKGAVGFKAFDRKLTFQDPCRLSRLGNRSDLPRKLINRLTSVEFSEMQDRAGGAICCGNNAWTGCDSYSKALQTKRIRQAKDTGSDLLVTACPKCQIHLQCAMEDPFFGDQLNMEMMDLTSILAKTINWE